MTSGRLRPHRAVEARRHFAVDRHHNAAHEVGYGGRHIKERRRQRCRKVRGRIRQFPDANPLGQLQLLVDVRPFEQGADPKAQRLSIYPSEKPCRRLPGAEPDCSPNQRPRELGDRRVRPRSQAAQQQEQPVTDATRPGVHELGKDRLKPCREIGNMYVLDFKLGSAPEHLCGIVPPLCEEEAPVVVPSDFSHAVRNECGLPDASLQAVDQFLHTYFHIDRDGFLITTGC